MNVDFLDSLWLAGTMEMILNLIKYMKISFAITALIGLVAIPFLLKKEWKDVIAVIKCILLIWGVNLGAIILMSVSQSYYLIQQDINEKNYIYTQGTYIVSDPLPDYYNYKSTFLHFENGNKHIAAEAFDVVKDDFDFEFIEGRRYNLVYTKQWRVLVDASESEETLE